LATCESIYAACLALPESKKTGAEPRLDPTLRKCLGVEDNLKLLDMIHDNPELLALMNSYNQSFFLRGSLKYEFSAAVSRESHSYDLTRRLTALPAWDPLPFLL
jgi:hypothetical protein